MRFAHFFLAGLVSGLTNTVNPLPGYQFSWTADTVAHKLSVEIVLTPSGGSTAGWVGFGIAGGAGGMLGADIFTVYSTGANTCQLDDRMATGKSLPDLDTVHSDGFSDWTLQSCSRVGEVLKVSASREFRTYDPYDLDFVSGPMELLFAWGKTKPTSSSNLLFHDGGYIPQTISLWGEAIVEFNRSALESDHDIQYVGMSGVPIGDDTTYLCQGFSLTQKDSKATQAIVFEPVISPISNEPYVHHMVLYACTQPVQVGAFECFSMPRQCTGIVYAWGKGGGPFVLPKVTGVPVGSSGRTYVALQMHYNNPARIKRLNDTSGVNIYRTNMLRAMDAGMILVGTTAMVLPPRKPVYGIAGSCPSTLTSLLPQSGVTAYASFMHAHQRGRRMWSEVVRNGVVIATLGNNQNYDFNLQKVQSITPTVQLLPGDEINTHCSYDTSNDTRVVTYGETTDNEMCFNFIAYYPVLGGAPTLHCHNDNDADVFPGSDACSLLPGDPPEAYDVQGWNTSNKFFRTGGNATCKPGFVGSAVVTCLGSGAPFTFSGCTRVRSSNVSDEANMGVKESTVSVIVLVLSMLFAWQW